MYFYRFDVGSDTFFTQSDRILIVDYVLQLGTIEEKDSGLKSLIAKEVYSAAYPLHKTNKTLKDDWARFDKYASYQPLDEIKDYFGVKIALYFAWLGFYTKMLIPISIFGIFCIIYGFSTLSGDNFVADICDPPEAIKMCPLCDGCDYWDLTDACLYSELTHTFDNIFTIIFSIVMSLWSVLFLNMWKRHSASIVHRWGLSNLQSETYCPRPEFVTQTERPWIRKQSVRILSAACALFWVRIFFYIF